MTRPSKNPQGNPRTSKPSTDLVVDLNAPFVVPPPPASLRGDAVKVWHLLWEAGRDAYNPRTDGHVIARYAEMSTRRDHLLETLYAEGFTTVGSQGQLVAHPAAKLLNDVEGKLLSLEDRLGLNPESRIRLGIATVEKESKLQAFLNAAT